VNSRTTPYGAEVPQGSAVKTVEESSQQPGTPTLHAATRLAWASSLVAVSLAVLALPLIAAGPPQDWLSSFLLALALSVIGLVIATHRPHNPIGWLYCAAGLC
jgi:hypothetical protein